MYKRGMDATSPIKFFQSFEKIIYFMGLELLVAAPSFSVEILICHLCTSCLTLPWQTSNSM